MTAEDLILDRLGLTRDKVRRATGAIGRDLKRYGLSPEIVGKYVVKVAKPLPETFNATRVTGGKEGKADV